MTDAWFGPDVPPSLAFLAFLSFLFIPASQGRFKSLLTTLWMVAIACAAVLLAGAAVAYFVEQPSHVSKALFILGSVLAVAFGSTLPSLRRAYQKAELRKMTAADI
jgi:hypothetical protein